MAKRPIFVWQRAGVACVREHALEFTWHAGFAKSQAQKSIQSLHDAAAKYGIQPVLEISSKSPEPLGVQLSAFNLLIETSSYGPISVETAYQGSKVFQDGQQYKDIYALSAFEAKTDKRIRASAELTAFNFMGQQWPLEPQTAFYDWLYCTALHQHPSISQQLLYYQGFSDIVFNPQRSINCQARAVALFVALQARGLLEQALSSQPQFITTIQNPDEVGIMTPNPEQELKQMQLL